MLFNFEIVCSCSSERFSQKLIFFSCNPKVRSVLIRSCPDLLLGLDFIGVNPSQMPFNIEQSGNIQLDFIEFDSGFMNNQHLRVNLRNIGRFSITGVHIDEPIKVLYVQHTKKKHFLFFKYFIV